MVVLLVNKSLLHYLLHFCYAFFVLPFFSSHHSSSFTETFSIAILKPGLVNIVSITVVFRAKKSPVVCFYDRAYC